MSLEILRLSSQCLTLLLLHQVITVESVTVTESPGMAESLGVIVTETETVTERESAAERDGDVLAVAPGVVAVTTNDTEKKSRQ